ncbi:MAG TPA: type II toxin-antitoxin system mRNA interferase toxin, RelE/StbE family [Patescibacteria group bacterium]|nr:type II toxin-antitoxin system mRNA interferase toxin, RelE/StbE family [Patescibacteria group bacterium]
MIVKNILFATRFVKELKKLPKNIIKIAVAKEELFKLDPLHPSLRLHELHGKFKGIWSISITSGYRIIFKRQPNGDILFISIGRHDIYKYL